MTEDLGQTTNVIKKNECNNSRTKNQLHNAYLCIANI